MPCPLGPEGSWVLLLASSYSTPVATLPVSHIAGIARALVRGAAGKANRLKHEAELAQVKGGLRASTLQTHVAIVTFPLTTSPPSAPTLPSFFFQQDLRSSYGRKLRENTHNQKALESGQNLNPD